MKVRALHTKAFNLTDNEELIAKIKREGKEVKAGSWPFPPNVQLNDMFFLLGGRNSIATVLKNVPNGKFTGDPVVVKVNTQAKLTNKYTIIAVSRGVFSGRFGLTREAWGTMFQVPTDEVSFNMIISKLWADENKIQEDVLGYAGLR